MFFHVHPLQLTIYITEKPFGADTSFLLDTRAAISSLLRKSTVDGFPLTVYGEASLPVSFGGSSKYILFAVAGRLTVEAILGLDFLNREQMHP